MLVRRVLRSPVAWRGWARTAACCAGEEAAPLNYSPPRPGTVPQHDHHVLLSLPGMGDDLGASWPSLVEREPAMLLAFASIARHKEAISGRVKITAMQSVPSLGAPGPGTCHMLAFPTGLAYQALPLSKLGQAVVHAVADDPSTLPRLDKETLQCQDLADGHDQRLYVFVCCHGARDARCGARGPALVIALRRAVRAAGLESRVAVAATSHLGGHQYAGNVVVHGAFHPCDGDWFGGLQAAQAAEFITALRDVPLGCDGGAGDVVLRRWWRGRMGLAPEDQADLFEAGGGFHDDDNRPEGVRDDDDAPWTEEEEELWRQRHPEDAH